MTGPATEPGAARIDAGDGVSPTAQRSPSAAPNDDAQARHISAYSTREKIARMLWAMAQGTVFKYSFHNWYGWRRWLLGRFGARLGPRTRLRRSVKIECPWNLTMGADSTVGDDARLYCLGPVTIGERTTISQLGHICAGTHDFTKASFPLIRPPVVIGDDVWIAADAFVGPDITVADGTVIGARASVFRSTEAWTVYGGNPAKPIRPRPRFDAPSP